VGREGSLMDSAGSDPIGGGDVDPWDQPEVLASVDEIFSRYYRRAHFNDTLKKTTTSLLSSTPPTVTQSRHSPWNATLLSSSLGGSKL
jgi:hypothetical protein